MFSVLNSKPVKRAVCYYRHSAEDKQENSVPIQREHAQKFAAQHNIEIIHEEADEGVSGLIANRPGFKRLFSDWVENPSAPQFDFVLFYDISRWGRFQDQNEGAHYAFICKKHGKTLVNVSRGFPQEGQQLTTSLIDSIDRFMAAEYSRVLSEKVWYGCIKVSKDGYSAGGTASYGMARLLLDENKNPIGMLKKGEHKMISNQRVTFTPIGDQSTKAVQEMFDLLVNHWKTPNEIAEIINEKGIPSANGGQWDRNKVLRILSNEIYAGTRIYNKTWGRLKQSKRKNPRSEWVIALNSFEKTISYELFAKAQEHLYWLMPNKWRKGIRAINRAQLSALKEIEQLLIKHGLDEGEVEAIIQKFPLILSINFYKNSIPHSCFVIGESLRKYEYVLGVSLELDKKELLGNFFLLPTQDFNPSNFLIIPEKDQTYNSYKIDKDDIEEKILFLQKIIQPLRQDNRVV